MCKVLVIDDEGMIRNLVKQALQMLDYAVETAQDGSVGIAKFDTDRYDLVITDVCMPEADGHQVVNHIRNSAHRWTPVIAMSGTPWNLNNHRFDEVLPKPFGIDQLMKTARSLTAGRCQPGSSYVAAFSEDSVDPRYTAS
jgi:DNA-binding response OmpR family regulator